MRIVIDLQAAQAANRKRGIGRYSWSLAQAVVRNKHEHEVLIALNGLIPDTIEPIRNAFADLLPRENIRVWHALGPVGALNAANSWRRRSAELVREAFLASLRPDVIHVSSVFEGLVDDAVTSVGVLPRTIPTAVTLYDLIPYIHRNPYLQDPAVAGWYFKKLEHLRRADLWLAISESSRCDGVSCLSLPEERSINISADADPHFRRIEIAPEAERAVRQKYGIIRPFIMYAGGIDHRKNIEGVIRAFAQLPALMRKTHQLAIVCDVQRDASRALQQLITQQRLSDQDVVLTGFVPEDDLVTLYNLCALFVFPSWHEGFGLPALEAMRCGAPVIGAITSSLPEVIGWEEALFDPHSDEAIAAAMERALSDDAFRAELLRKGELQSAKFSWDETARRTIAAMESVHSNHHAVHRLELASRRRPRLAYVSPLPPERSGIADYSAELLPQLARLYEIDVIVAQGPISDPQIKANYPVRSTRWFMENANRYERVLYHFGNSVFHEHMFDMLSAIPGVVVLHDVFLSSVVAHRDAHISTANSWASELYIAHGYAALRERFHNKNVSDVIWKYPCSLSVIQQSLGVIVHSSNPQRLAEEWYGNDCAEWAIIPLLRGLRLEDDRKSARKALGFDQKDVIVCAFGVLGPTKLNQRLLDAWFESRLCRDDSCYLVFVGESPPGHYGQQLLSTIGRRMASQHVRVTGWADPDVFQRYLSAADIGVQLRALSRGETSAAVLDCMNYGLATIVNANGSMADLDDEAVWKLPDEFATEELVGALETLRNDATYRHRIGETARGIVTVDHHPRVCADRYGEQIERFYLRAASSLSALPQAIAGIEDREPANADLMRLADAICQSFTPANRPRQLLVDVSELVQRDSSSGIQRVVKSIIREWLRNSPANIRVELVYATTEKPGYYYARRYALRFLDCPTDLLDDAPIEFTAGDLFLGLDLQPHVVHAQEAFYQHMRRLGVWVKFVIYDLLPIHFPQGFVPRASDDCTNWLKVVLRTDGAICISRTVAKDLRDWIHVNAPEYHDAFSINRFQLGADIEPVHVGVGLPIDSENVLKAMAARPTFVQVGTIEPRKGHGQVLDAFELLWREGQDIGLAIVGKPGWMVEALVDRLRSHRELGKRLFWLEGISDEYLEKVYMGSICLIAASYGEGFGLPLIEAAQHKLPIIARDIPVFREVAGKNAFYFSGASAVELASSIRKWRVLAAQGKAPPSKGIRWQSWSDSARELAEIVVAQCGTHQNGQCDAVWNAGTNNRKIEPGVVSTDGAKVQGNRIDAG